MSTDTVKVTAQHIANGVPREPDACPIALALRDLHPDVTIDVYNRFAVILAGPDTGSGLAADLPGEATEFIQAFDYHEDVGPFEFELTWLDRDETSLKIEVGE